MEAVKSILALVNNLMFSVKIREAASAMGGIVNLVTTNEEIIEKLEIHPSLIILDLTAVKTGWEDVVTKAKEAGIPVLAYGPHIEEQLRKSAEAAGCDEVVAKSMLDIDLSNLLAKYLNANA
jgi:CheY-like chemotaxis protein